MKITIDTKEDSREEIKRIVNMLNSLIEAEGAAGQSGEPQPILGEGIFGMFSDNKEENAPYAQPETSSESEVAGLFSENLEKSANVPEPKVVDGVKKEDEDDEPRIVFY